MADVRLEGLKKTFGTIEILSNIDLTIDHGEFVIFVGPSGSGKSTLLRMIGGLEPISGGRLLIDNELVNDIDAADRNLGMVFQSYALYPHMTVKENLAFPLRMAKAGKAAIARQDSQNSIAIADRPSIGAQASTTFRRATPARRNRARHHARTKSFPVR
ncbi:ABC-type sugar transport system ATPase subunit [Bradyrhizobium ottawaense]